MIGVLTECNLNIVKEFFENFKISWEVYNPKRAYDIVISDKKYLYNVNSNVLIVFNSEETNIDLKFGIRSKPLKNDNVVFYKSRSCPLYSKVSEFNTKEKIIIRSNNNRCTVGFVKKTKNINLIRIGYNLFCEINILLTKGQPSKFSLFPTMDIHKYIIKDIFITHKIPFIEISSRPNGKNYFVCLTHDVDFISIKKNLFDYTILGFVYRSTIKTLINLFYNKVNIKKLLINYLAVIKLPLVYLNLCDDFWNQFERYSHIEKDIKSTYFIIPKKQFLRWDKNNIFSKRRNSKYDITELKREINILKKNGNEIALHGMDSWYDFDMGLIEKKIIEKNINEKICGVRIHWLYNKKETMRILEKSGFKYDSTMGYNETIGFKNGTTQVFKPIGTYNFYELPLNIQDTSLFYSGRMNLSENEALELINNIKETLKIYGGVLTLNWHQRSLAPERLWDDFYITLINMLKEDGVKFAKAIDIVKWYETRRSLKLKEHKDNIIIELDKTKKQRYLKYRIKIVFYNYKKGKNIILNNNNYIRKYKNKKCIYIDYA